VKVTIVLFASLVTGCLDDIESAEARRAREWSEPCHDASRLIATTAGSMSDFECSNKRHRMRVQVATHPSNEEAAALVFCECDRGEAATKVVP
jgi:hypothetical protein